MKQHKSNKKTNKQRLALILGGCVCACVCALALCLVCTNTNTPNTSADIQATNATASNDAATQQLVQTDNATSSDGQKTLLQRIFDSITTTTTTTTTTTQATQQDTNTTPTEFNKKADNENPMLENSFYIGPDADDTDADSWDTTPCCTNDANDVDIYWGYTGTKLTISSEYDETTTPNKYTNSTANTQPAWFEYTDETTKQKVYANYNMTEVEIIGDTSIKPVSTRAWFGTATEAGWVPHSKITSITGLDKLDTSNIVDASFMFTTVGLASGFTTPKDNPTEYLALQKASAMYAGSKCYPTKDGVAQKLTLGTSGDTSKTLTDTSYMFSSAQNVPESFDVSGFYYTSDTTVKIRAQYMFLNCSTVTNITGGFNIGSLKSARAMFNNTNLETIDLSGVYLYTTNANLINMFRASSKLTSIFVPLDADWSNATENNYGIFMGCEKLKGNNGTSYSETNVTNESGIGLAKIDNLYVNNSGEWLAGELQNGLFCTKAKAVINDTSMAFYYDTIDHSASSEASFKGTVYYIPLNNSGGADYAAYHTPWYGTSGAYDKAKTITNVTFDETFKGYKPPSTAYWFREFKALTSVNGIGPAEDISYLDTSNVTNMKGMFYLCNSLTSLDISAWNTNQVTNMSYFASIDPDKATGSLTEFKGPGTSGSATSLGDKCDCSYMLYAQVKLTSATFEFCNVSNVIALNHWFWGCTALQTVNMTLGIPGSSYPNTRSCNFDRMFLNCGNLTTIYAQPSCNWYTYSKQSDEMFLECNSLKGGAGTTYTASVPDARRACIDGGPSSSTPGYFTNPSSSSCDTNGVTSGSVSGSQAAIQGSSATVSSNMESLVKARIKRK